MKYLKIYNSEPIDVKAFELIGASTKTDNPEKIGMFGSGLNYSIAWLLRSNIKFHVFTDRKEIKFSVRRETFRNVDFERIYINNRKTSFTTKMGKDWKAWYVIREIWANALDESDCYNEIVEELEYTEGTAFYIQITPEIDKVVKNWNNYFSNKRKDLIEENEGIKIFEGGGEGLTVYRKGIRCFHDPTIKSLFHYDFPRIIINESRVVVSRFELEFCIKEYFAELASVDVLRKLFEGVMDNYEGNLDWSYTTIVTKERWQEAIDGRTIVEHEFAGHYSDLVAKENPFILPANLVTRLLKTTEIEHVAGSRGKMQCKPVELDDKGQAVLKKALDFCKECEIDITYPIETVEFPNNGSIMGRAKDKTIFVSIAAIERGVREVVSVLLEEQIHLDTGFEDETRKMQNHLLNLIIEEKSSRFAYLI